ncbi:MAG: histidine phosphatase family protein [Pseudomonadota bacterium]
MPEPTLVTVLRHGAVFGPAQVYRGRTDAPLSPAGRAAMTARLPCLAVPPFTQIATSPRSRCRDFAAGLADQLGQPLTVLEAMAEMDFGAWEGLSPAQAQARDPSSHAAFRQGRGGAPGGETLADFRARVAAGWSRWLAQADGGHRLLVTHGGVMRALLMDLGALDPARPFAVALPETAHFRVSLLAGWPPVLLSLNPCTA